MMARGDFGGAKLALICRGRILCLRRDRNPAIPFPGRWDLPGGGREGTESPAACVRRELHEETGLRLRRGRLGGGHWHRPRHLPERGAWFFIAHVPLAEAARARLGAEGDRLCWMTPCAFARHPRAVPHLARCVVAARRRHAPRPPAMRRFPRRG